MPDKDKQSNNTEKNSKPQGMGLADRSKKKAPAGSNTSSAKSPGNKQKSARGGNSSGGSTDKKKQLANGQQKMKSGAEKASKGAARAAQGAGRVAAGDLTGAKDAAVGAKEALDGAKDIKSGVDDVKDATSKSDEASDGKSSSGSSSKSGKSRGFNESMTGGMKGLMDKALKDEDSDDPLSDAIESGSDSAGDNDDDMSWKSIKDTAKKAAVGAGGGAGAVAFQGAMQLIQWMKMLLAKGLMALTNAWAAIVGFVTNIASWVATVTGLSAIVSMMATIGTIATTTLTVVAVTISLVTGSIAQRDDVLDCIPSNTKVANSVAEWQNSGEYAAMRAENLKKAWSVFDELGIDAIVAAGILGNFDHESGLDPTGVETIFGEPYEIGPKKAAAESAGFEMSVMNPSYAAKFPGVKQGGIGLGQWSNGRNGTLREYAKSRGLLWHDIGTQLAFMFDGDNKGDIDVLWSIANDPNITIDSATSRFMLEWERPNAAAANLPARQVSAAQLYLELQTTEVDSSYAQSIISAMNVDVAESNNMRSAYFQDDGCGNEVRTNYSGQADGTGVFPADAGGTIWSPASMPNSVAKFAHDPAELGLGYGNSSGWNLNTSQPGQCVAFAHAYMQALYPGTTAPRGVNGGEVAKAWYEAYKDTLGGTLSAVPSAGAVFQHDNSRVYGHAGVVDHVFANGDILIVEQNIRGYSGDNNGKPNTWSWRLITKSQYTEETGGTRNWMFYKPDKAPAW